MDNPELAFHTLSLTSSSVDGFYHLTPQAEEYIHFYGVDRLASSIDDEKKLYNLLFTKKYREEDREWLMNITTVYV